ncbi:MAG: hypothetical protein IJ218_02715 [Alphaproteobacteria bacterium]|nr:hypothetical protein [Alphaproteobacteria bacterium]
MAKEKTIKKSKREEVIISEEENIASTEKAKDKPTEKNTEECQVVFENKAEIQPNTNVSTENVAATKKIMRLLSGAIVVLGIISYIMIQKYAKLAEKVKALEENLSLVEQNVSQNVDENRKIYVFNMDETVKGIGLQEKNQKFEADINNLDAQVKEAQATITDLKDEVMKAKILNLTIKPLQMKRDDLLEEYSKSMQQSLAQINEALAELATENNVPTIFMNKSVAVNTNYVVDVTPTVIEKIKAKQQK